MLFVVTPTHDRPEGYALLRKWLGTQKPGEEVVWVVAHDGPEEYDYGPRAVVIRRRGEPGPGSLAANVAAAVRAVLDNSPDDDDTIAIMEDDDWYAPEYLWTIRQATRTFVPLVGLKPTRYYNIKTGRYGVSRVEGHASLATTAFRVEAAGVLLAQCEKSPRLLDRAFWRAWCDSGGRSWIGTQEGMHLSIKGLPGTRGFTRQHDGDWGQPDPEGDTWRSWGIPDDYLALASPAVADRAQGKFWNDLETGPGVA
jgi:hypothetical protein